jgi:uncharacterized membrane protein YkvA (DUF1232 family)
MFEGTNPKTLVKYLLLAALIYLVFPYDLFPDFLGFPGRLDDLLVMAWLAWVYRNHARQFITNATDSESSSQSANAGSGQAVPPGSKPTAAFNPYEVLGIPRSASRKAIQAAYRSRMQQYHPDKVAHLGEDLQKLATEKSQQIQRAYKQLCG